MANKPTPPPSPPPIPTKTIITRIRQEIGRGSVPTADVLRLCERSEELLAVALKMEGALHDALKIIEKNKLTAF